MTISAARYRRQREEARARRGSGGRFFKLQDGTNKVRIFPFKHVVNELDMRLGRYTKADTKEGVTVGTEAEELNCHHVVHFLGRGKIINCTLDDDCPVCEDARQLKTEEGRDSRRYREISARQQYVFNAVDVAASELEVRLLTVPSTVYDEVMRYLEDPEIAFEELFGPEGRDFIVERDTDASPAQMYSVRLREPKFCKSLPEALADDVQDLFLLPELLPGHGLQDFEVPKEIEDAAGERKRSKPAAKQKARKAEPKEEEEQGSGPEPGDRVSVDFDGEAYEGEILNVDDLAGKAAIKFDDGEMLDVPFDEIEVLPPLRKTTKKASRKDEEEVDAEEDDEEETGEEEPDEEEDEDSDEEQAEDDDGGPDPFRRGNWVKFELDGETHFAQITSDPDVNSKFEIMESDGTEYEVTEDEVEAIDESEVPQEPASKKASQPKRPAKKAAKKAKKKATRKRRK